MGGGREKTRRKSKGQGMKCPNTDQGTLDVSMDLPLKYSYTKAEINMIKVVFWSDLADCGEQDQRQENLKDINSSPIGRP